MLAARSQSLYTSGLPGHCSATILIFSISMRACDPVPMVMGLRLAALQAAGAPLQII